MSNYWVGGVHPTNLDWVKVDLKGALSFKCDCCNSTKYYEGSYMKGEGLFGRTVYILCHDCYPFRLYGNCPCPKIEQVEEEDLPELDLTGQEKDGEFDIGFAIFKK
jgi:hypothetical protein